MIRLGLIGYPLGHSLSPKIHMAALNACGLQGNYSLFPIHPDDNQGLKDLLNRVRVGEITGLNVTIPHKQNAIELLDKLTPTAKTIGAVNTIYFRENKLIGDNTDAPGFLKDLNRFMVNLTSNIEYRRSVIVLGAGGSARAVVHALLNDDWQVTISARRYGQAEKLTSSFPQHEIRIINYELSNIDLSNIDLIVNTTPLGMTPNTDQSPLPENTSLSPQTIVYDLVYNPRETKLVKDARAQGLKATTGFGMLIEQAMLAFEIWTGHKPPREILLDAVNQTAH